MAASDILAIWNDALGNIGSKASIASLTEQSAEAAACALRYQGVVESILRQTNWNCSRMTAALDDITATFAPPARWPYRYAWPESCLRLWQMQNPTGFLWRWPAPVEGYEVAIDNDPAASDLPTRYIYSDQAELSAIFTQYSFDIAHGYHEALFDPSLKEAIGWALAAAVAGSLTGNAQIVAQTRAEALRMLADAMAANANESAPNSMDIPEAESLAVRGFGDYWPYCGPAYRWR